MDDAADEYLVFGFIRGGVKLLTEIHENPISNIVPDHVFLQCLSFYHQLDRFQKCGNKHITFSRIGTTVQFNGLDTAYGYLDVDCGDVRNMKRVFKWNVVVNRMGKRAADPSGDVMISGIAIGLDEASRSRDNGAFHNGNDGYPNYAMEIASISGKQFSKLREWGSRTGKRGFAIEEGDTVTLELDITARRLYIHKMNDAVKTQTVHFSDIDVDDVKYCLAVSSWKGCNVTLISCQATDR